VSIAAVVCAVFHLDVATVHSRFGTIPRSLPIPSLPPFSFEKLQAVLPDAVAIALLGAIESLLSAVVADGMTGRRHRSNCELSAQGVANITSVLFGGICVTGTVARTATNVRAGARGPVSGIFHCGYLLIFLLIGAPLVSYIPLAALGAVLAVVAWNMAEKEEFWSLLRGSRGDAVVLLSTFCSRFSSTSSPPSPRALYWARCYSCIEWRRRWKSTVFQQRLTTSPIP
jgi:sulfate permease, SulP family